MSNIIEDEFPVRSEDLIMLMDEYFPLRLKHRGESDEEYNRYAGARVLIDSIIAAFTEAHGRPPGKT